MRGQAHTLEAVVAGVILLASLVFALQVTAVTPLSASTANQHIENQQLADGEGLLTIADDSGALKDAVLYVDPSTGLFHGAGEDGYYTDDANVTKTRFGRMLRETFDDRGIAFNVNVVYYSGTGVRREKRFIHRGVPSDNAVTATKMVTLYADDHLVRANETTDPDVTLADTVEDPNAAFYATNAIDGTTGLYNVVEVEVVLWRM